MKLTALEEKQIAEIKVYMEQKLGGERSGHDAYHGAAVARNAVDIMQHETRPVAAFVVLASSFLHDVVDEKVVPNVALAEQELRGFLTEQLTIPSSTVTKIMENIQKISFSKNLENRQPLTLEAQILQDADRLEALGAVGIARTFYYAGKKGDALYDETLLPRQKLSYAAYRHQPSTALNHFFEKLLKLTAGFNTERGKVLAREREAFMKVFLRAFIAETQLTAYSELLENEED